MLNFEIKSSSRKCSQTQREFAPGELFYSALWETADGGTERRDYAADQWTDPSDQEDCIGWWKARVPLQEDGAIHWAPREVLLAYFEHLLEQPEQMDVAFVVALVLIQKKILAQVDEEPDPPTWVLRNRSPRQDYRVPVVDVAPSRLAEIQAELSEKLFTDELIDPLDEEGADDE